MNFLFTVYIGPENATDGKEIHPYMVMDENILSAIVRAVAEDTERRGAANEDVGDRFELMDNRSVVQPTRIVHRAEIAPGDYTVVE